ncbi:MAG: hypothetical protein ACR2MN_01640 [Acidimicrobiales bacterium]
MAHTWTYLFADLRTNVILGQVPLAQVSFASQLNATGSFSAQVLLSDPVVQRALSGVAGGAGGLLQTGRTAIYVDMDGELVWGGILWTSTYDSTSRVVQLGGLEAFVRRSRRFESSF